MKFDSEKELADSLSLEEAAKLAGLSPRTLKNKRYLGGDGPPYIKNGGHVVYPRARFEEWLKSRIVLVSPKEGKREYAA